MTATTSPTTRPSLRWAVSDVLTMIGRKLRHVLRTPDELIVSLILPITMMLLFVFVFGGALDRSGGYVDYAVPGVLILSAGFSASQTGIGLTSDLVTGVVDRFRSLPIVVSSVLTGHVVANLLRNLVSTTLVILVALLIGFRPAANVLEWAAAFGVVALYILMISWLSMIFGLLAKTVEGAGQFSFVILFLPYLSSAFVPTETMPDALRVVADNQPATPVIETVRALLTGSPVGNSAAWALGWCVGLGALAFVISSVLFVRRTSR
ncbi:MULTISPECIES: ABC transporter permease [Actinoalloteichus]|uniref:Transport permease protein n=1 Tax=Actinoalloteichus fjordicus TaxID=1612552 RepID=A0AAC9LBJ1_9PSEU|nr:MULTISPECIES: ABC transporter permease [Actinoalloteichus]APU14321.1 ABC-type polysaccharide/polyol phosphate export system, permease component [Actinoalloteichus fjordicus]APU20290.1 ABC-type polysaccharide/polyol phosphate export system, permease component [Actinoalloteichus sp. GBA129-24]